MSCGCKFGKAQLKQVKGATAGVSCKLGLVSATRDLQSFLQWARLKLPEKREDLQGHGLLMLSPASFYSGTDDRFPGQGRSYDTYEHKEGREGESHLWTSEA